MSTPFKIEPALHLRLMLSAVDKHSLKRALMALAHALDEPEIGTFVQTSVTVGQYDLLTSDQLTANGISPDEFLYLGWHAEDAIE